MSLSIMHRWLAIAGLLILSLASQGTLEGSTILLKNGHRLDGDIVKRTEKEIIIDLGFDLVRIPGEEIDQILEITPEEGKHPDTGKHLYRVGEGETTLSVKENSLRLGEAVVEVRTPSSLGSGFIINELGYLITNNHVISGENDISIIVYAKGARELEKLQFKKVKIVALSPALDLALLKIEGKELPKFTSIPLGSSDGLQQGQPIFAIGSPLGLGRTVSQGIVSIKNRAFEDGLLYIQHTAEINPGNSGGPLFNLQGEVIGVTNMKLAMVGVEGVGFAIPATILKFFIDNRDAFAFDPRHPNAGYRYLAPPGISTDTPSPSS